VLLQTGVHLHADLAAADEAGYIVIQSNNIRCLPRVMQQTACLYSCQPAYVLLTSAAVNMCSTCVATDRAAMHAGLDQRHLVVKTWLLLPNPWSWVCAARGAQSPTSGGVRCKACLQCAPNSTAQCAPSSKGNLLPAYTELCTTYAPRQPSCSLLLTMEGCCAAAVAGQCAELRVPAMSLAHACSPCVRCC
jgi:hypothetical protein